MSSSRIVLGCGNFGGIGSAPAFFGQGESEEEAVALMDTAWELGIRSFDTADAYGGGRSETWIGHWMHTTGRRPRLTTKVFHSVVGDPADEGLSRDRVLRQIEGSLTRLGVDRVETYMVHETDPDVPVAETMGAFAELVDRSLVGEIGASNVDVAWLEAALSVASVGVVQNSYSLLDRESEPVLDFCAARGIRFEVFGPLAGGWLTGKYRRDAAPPEGSRMTQRPEPYREFESDEVYDALERFEAAASERGADMPTLAFAWLLSDPRVSAVVVGPRRPEHLGPSLAAAQVSLSEAERDEVASLFP
ncbi:MAG TPA: aldo/keto reductase [Gaiellaceae bacterium]|nr:aldo/keto reductase [Gaiellaceae bacterium]